MNARALTGLIRFLAVTYVDLHRYCRIYFAEELDAGERRKQAKKRRLSTTKEGRP